MDEFENQQEDLNLPIPFKCILPECSESITSETIVSHFHSEHHIDFQEAQQNEKILLAVSTGENFLHYGTNVCLGMLGIKLKDQGNPLPIAIMACRNNYQQLYGIKNPHRLQSDFITLWLVSPQIENRISAVMTVYDDDHNFSMSSSMELREITATQNALHFTQNEINQLVVNPGILEKISKDDTMFLEIIVSENFM